MRPFAKLLWILVVVAVVVIVVVIVVGFIVKTKKMWIKNTYSNVQKTVRSAKYFNYTLKDAAKILATGSLYRRAATKRSPLRPILVLSRIVSFRRAS